MLTVDSSVLYEECVLCKPTYALFQVVLEEVKTFTWPVPESPEPQDELDVAEPEDAPEPAEEPALEPPEESTPEPSEVEHEEPLTVTVDKPASEPSGSPEACRPLEPLYAVPEDNWEGFIEVTYKKKRPTYHAPSCKPSRSKRAPLPQTAPLAALRPPPRMLVTKQVIYTYSEHSE